MDTTAFTKFWPLIQSTIQEFLEVTEPHVEEIAIQQNIPLELYTYSEFGLESFSREDFQKRDPYSNPVQFEKVFVTLNFKGWIEPQADNTYRVTDHAREAARSLIEEGNKSLLPFESFTNIDLERLAALLKQIVLASKFAPPPPDHWAVVKRFSLLGQESPLIVRIREYLLDLHAIYDDCHYAAAHPHFGRAGIAWLVLGALDKNDTVTAEQLADDLLFRGYDASHYEVALQAAAQIGWAQLVNTSGAYCITAKGRELREQVEHLTNEYFYATWSLLHPNELDELYELLLNLRDQLNSFRKTL
jgi:hypothetical protein